MITRRKFLRMMGVVIGAATVAPTALLENPAQFLTVADINRVVKHADEIEVRGNIYGFTKAVFNSADNAVVSVRSYRTSNA